MARKKRHDLEHHIAIARLVLQGVSCRRAAITITGEIGGNEKYAQPILTGSTAIT